MKLPLYTDHIRLWADELQPWLPSTLFDAHVHIGPPEVMAPLSSERLNLPLGTFSHLTYESLEDWYKHLFSDKNIAGLIAFPFPLQEVDIEKANQYIIDLMKRDLRVKGFALAHPTDADRTVAKLEKAMEEGVRFFGIKPYFDLLGKDVLDCSISEFVPEPLLARMNRDRLMMMLHTSLKGIGDRRNQDYLRGIVESYPDIRIILAHMGRYLEANDFFRFCDSGLLEYPMLYLEMSSASRMDVYCRVLEHPEIFDRLLFGSDLPFGLITGMEYWSKKTGPIFVTRDQYPWSNPDLEKASGLRTDTLTYNTYHTIKAFKDAVCSLRRSNEQVERLEEAVFYRNAASLFADA